MRRFRQPTERSMEGLRGGNSLQAVLRDGTLYCWWRGCGANRRPSGKDRSADLAGPQRKSRGSEQYSPSVRVPPRGRGPVLPAEKISILDGLTVAVSNRAGNMNASPDQPRGFFSLDTRRLSPWS